MVTRNNLTTKLVKSVFRPDEKVAEIIATDLFFWLCVIECNINIVCCIIIENVFYSLYKAKASSEVGIRITKKKERVS